jgi:transcriptional regulator with XRE-family HTH domain
MDTTLAPLATKKTYTGIAERILKLLAAGVSQEEVANATGVTTSYVSQLLDDADFAKQVQDLKTISVTAQLETDDAYNETEKFLALQLKKVAPFILDPDKIIRTLTFLNNAKRKTAQVPVNPGDQVAHIVALVLPASVRKEYIVNPQNEVIQVEGTQLQTLPVTKLDELLQRKREAEEIKYVTHL